jgi:leucyl-tRNA synthetase
MREEMETMGFGYDWERELTTCEPEYYRWNQYFFREFYANDLVEYRSAQVNWCPDCETVLADAQVVEGEGGAGSIPREPGSENGDGHGPSVGEGGGAGGLDGHDGGVCWRCGTPVGRRDLDQWFLTITEYADELVQGLDDLDGWPEGVRKTQRNWIGKQEGARVHFPVDGHGDVAVFTTRLDTVCGATYLALSPGHDLSATLAESDEVVADYVDTVGGETGAGGMSGVETAAVATNPVTGEEIPVYVAGYVLDDVGTGAIMGVPAHNERDHAFALEQDLPIEQVVEPVGESTASLPAEPFTEDGAVTNSGEYDGLAGSAARERLLADLDVAEAATTYRLRDWLVSRQRYWGTPIPVVHCEDCGPVLVPEEDLPVELPEFVQTTGNPLERIDSFVETACPDCGGPAERETDTMDTFVDSSWYFLRYLSPDRADAPFDADLARDWMPVDVYVGGEEHAVLHLLYIRFFARALADLGLIEDREPVERLVNQGTVLHGGEKMSKTKGNAITPHEYGAETTRLFVLGAAHPEQDFEWTAKDVGSAYDLQQTLHDLVTEFVDRSAGRDERRDHDDYVAREIDRTVAAATADYDRFRFHQAVNEIRRLATLLRRYRDFQSPNEAVYRRGLGVLARLVAPMAPYLGEELWNALRGDGIVAVADWPEPRADVADYDKERDLVRSMRADVRDIVEVAGIEDAETVEVAVAPAWKFRAYGIARRAGPETELVRQIVETAGMAEHGTVAQRYAEALQARREGLAPVLSRDEEFAELRRAAWLLADEFDAAVEVRRAAPGDDLAAKARPGKPAIHIR